MNISAEKLIQANQESLSFDVLEKVTIASNRPMLNAPHFAVGMRLEFHSKAVWFDLGGRYSLISKTLAGANTAINNDFRAYFGQFWQINYYPESVLRQLPAPERSKVAHWPVDELEEGSGSTRKGQKGGRAPAVPDYATRRRRIFGNKVLPNMVLVSRSEERW